MLFWIIATLPAFAIAATLAFALLRPNGNADGQSEDIIIYRDQLAEVDRDLARGVLDADEAERTRTEIARRLIAADKAGGAVIRDAPRWPTLAACAATGLILIAGSLWIYLQIGAPGSADSPRALRLAEAEAMRNDRISQTEAEAQVPDFPRPDAPQPPQDILDTVERLRASLAADPDDLQGWQVLTDFETRMGNMPAAVAAMTEVVRIKGESATVAELTGLVDRMVFAAQGYVSPEAEAYLDRIAAVEPRNLAVSYYMGLLFAQTDRPDLAFGLWRTVIEDGRDSLHATLARNGIADVAYLSGRDYTPPPLPGPTADQVAAAADMAPEDRMEMIRGMVSQLNERLATEGGTAEEWARLISSYGVLGETDQARAIWTEAQVRFADVDDAMTILRDAAASADVLE
jgi:cytochrome c-type biogenesis protein CcmH